MIIIKSAAKKTLLGTLGAAALFVGGTQVAQADTLKINAGDTVWDYSQKYHVSIDDIVKANKLADANMIVAGQSINIPGVQTGSVASTTVASSAVATSTVASSSAVVASSAATTSTSATVASSAAVTTSASSAATTATANVATSASTTTQASTTTRTTQPQSAPATNNSGQQAVGNGSWNSYLGQAYSYGNLDCSGLVQRVYGSRVKGRTTYTQQSTGAHNYNVYSAPKGALVFFGSDSAPYHVGISNGDGTFTHAPKTGDVVKVTSMKYYTPSYYVMPR